MTKPPLKSLTQAATGVGLLVLGALGVRYALAVPDVVPATAPASEFSAERAMTHVRAIAQRPHPVGSRDHARVGAYIMSTLSGMGLDPIYQEATGVGTRYPQAGHVGNIIAHIPGASTRGRSSMVLLMAHYDGVGAGPAAGDDASGSAVLLEVARALRAGPPPRNDVLLLFTDGEETGLLGAAAFVREHPYGSRIGVTMNFEARGTRGPSMMFETGPGNLDVARALRGVGGARATSLSTAVYRRLPNDTDLSEIAILSKPALNFAFIGGSERYHTSGDDVEHLDPRSVQDHGDQALALARVFGNEPLPRPVTSDAVFFDMPLLGLIVYPESWATPLAALVLLLVVLALVLLRRTDPRWLRDAAIGGAAAIVAALLAVGVGVATTEALRRLHVAIGSGAPAWSGVYLTAVAVLAFAVALAVYAVARAAAATRGAHIGALLVWAVLSVVVAMLAPGASFLLTWPALFGAAVAIAMSMSVGATIRRIKVWVAAAVAATILVPTLYLTAGVALGLGALSATLVSALTALGAWLVAPLLEDLVGPRRWHAPLSAAVVGVGLVAMGAATVRHDARNPARASLVYAFDADENSAWLAGSAGTALGRTYVRSAVGALPASNESASPPAWMLASYSHAGIGRAPIAAVAVPTIEVLGEMPGGDSRLVGLRIRAAPHTLAIGLSMDSALVRASAVNGRPIDRRRYRRPDGRRWTLTFAAPPDTGFVIEFILTTTDTVQLTVQSMTAGLPALPGVRVPERPPEVLASQSGDITLVHQQVRF